MTTRELIEHLKRLDPGGNLEVIRTMCSDYEMFEPDMVGIVEGVKRPSAGYVMRSHWNKMSAEDEANIRQFVHFEGN